MSGVHEGRILQDVAFRLFSWVVDAGRSKVVWTQYRGAWGLVDNGCHKWSCKKAPSKTCLLKKEQRLSDWIDSFRKDTECVFGILNGRFRVLKTGIRVDGPESADKIWLTCCALHNCLLEADGLNDWEGEIGLNDMSYASFALQRLCQTGFQFFGSREHENAAASAKKKPPRSLVSQAG
jgi:hypothetical protein